MLRFALVAGLLAFSGCSIPPSAFDAPPAAANAINSRLVPDSCVNRPGLDGRPGMRCQVRIAPSRTQELSTLGGTIILKYDRAQISDPAFIAGLRAFFGDLQVVPIESAITIAQTPGGPIDSRPSVNISLTSQCIHDPNLPENQRFAGSAVMLARPGGTLCMLFISGRGGNQASFSLGS